jgi:oligosaccharide reducing-end xylanase
MYFKKSFTVVLLFVLLLMSIVFAGVDAPFEIGTWGNFAKGAVSHTFDDWPTSGATQITATGMDAFDEKKIHMTIFISTDGLTSDNWKSLQTAYSHGHEVGSHNQQHSTDASGVINSHNAIIKNVPGEKAVSIAYPFCNPLGDEEVLKYYIAGRICNEQINNKTPGNFAQIGAKGVGAGGGNYPNDVASFNSVADQAANTNGWAVYMHHGIGSDNHSWAVTNLNELKKHLDYLDKNRDKIWAETFGNVARYIKERDAVSLTVKSSANSMIIISCKDNLADSIYNYPLTIRCPFPDGWETAAITQNNKPVENSIVTINSKKYIMFNAVPDGGDIVIASGEVSVSGTVPYNQLANTVVLNKSKLIINTDGFSAGPIISISLFNLKGELITGYSFNNRMPSFSVPIGAFSNSAFIVKITDGKRTFVSRCLFQKCK